MYYRSLQTEFARMSTLTVLSQRTKAKKALCIDTAPMRDAAVPISKAVGRPVSYSTPEQRRAPGQPSRGHFPYREIWSTTSRSLEYIQSGPTEALEAGKHEAPGYC